MEVNNSKATLFQFQIGYLRAENGRLDVVWSSDMAGYEMRMAGWISKGKASLRHR
jgi:hypothetical protein